MTQEPQQNKTEKLPFTGERFIPHQTEPVLALEHYHRYLFASHFVKGKTVLDIACGEGYGTAFLSTQAKEVVGIDIDEQTILHARQQYKKFPNVSFSAGRCEDFTVPGKTFDLVASFETLEHIDLPAQHLFLKNIKRSMKDEGVLFISSPERVAYAEANRGVNEFHKHEFTKDELSEFLGQYFKHVTVLGQKPLTLSAMWNLEDWESDAFQFQLGKDFFSKPESKQDFTQPVYLVAVCSDAKLPANLIQQSNSLYYDVVLVEQTKNALAWAQSLDTELQERKQYVAKLQKDFEERTAWALRTDKEFRERVEWAKKLNDELAGNKKQFEKLQKEFQERSTWAASLNSELEKSKEYTGKLQKEFEERSAWALSLSNELKMVQEKFNDTAQKYIEADRKSRELQVWGEILERQLNHITASPVYRLLAFIGFLPKYKQR